MLKWIKILLLLSTLITACTKSSSPSPAPTVTPVSLVSISGGVVTMQTTDPYQTLVAQKIVLSDGSQIPDGFVMRALSKDLLISSDLKVWVNDILVKTANGSIQFYVEPGTNPGIYQVYLYPVGGQSIVFNNNLSADFFVEVNAGLPATIGDISTNNFIDYPPYTGVKLSSEPWYISADPNLTNYFIVGPIKDPYGNLVNQGSIKLVVAEGQITSPNPAVIADGYTYFSYQATNNIGQYSVTASVEGLNNINLVKNSSFFLAEPQIEFLSNADFTGMAVGATKTITIPVKNIGGQPANSLNISVSPPFVLLPEQSDSCHQMGQLRYLETCNVRVQFTNTGSLAQNGILTIQGQPDNFVSNYISLPLIQSNTYSPQLVITNSVLNFPPTQCGTTVQENVVVTNVGKQAATNVRVQTEPGSSIPGNVPYFTVSIPPRDATYDPNNTNKVQNCGSTFDPGVQCNVLISFTPKSAFSTAAPVGAVIEGDNSNILTLAMNGTSISGGGYGNIPITFQDYTTLLPISSIEINLNKKVLVRVGPITDSCNNPVADGTLIYASVTGGLLDNLVQASNGGSAQFIWSPVLAAQMVGTQSITITSNGLSNQVPFLFNGVNLSLSGPTDLGIVFIQNPQTYTYTLANYGNIAAKNIQFNFTNPLALNNIGTCGVDLAPGATCTFTVISQPTITSTLNSSITATSSSNGLNQISLNNIITKSQSQPNLVLDQSRYAFDDGSDAAVVTKTILLTNYGPTVSYNDKITVPAPYSLKSTTCSDSLGVNQSCQIVITVNKTDALNSPEQVLTITNNSSSFKLQAYLDYAFIDFNANNYSYNQFSCIGPFFITSTGENNQIMNLFTQDLPITLSSQSGQVNFFSDANCANLITTVNLPANRSQSDIFYFRSFIAQSDIVSATLATTSLPAATLSVNFNLVDQSNYIKHPPQFVMRASNCILCHSSINGSMTTDFGFTGTSADKFPVGLYGTDLIAGDSFMPNWQSFGNPSTGYGTSFFQGKIIAPPINIYDTTTLAQINSVLTQGQGTVSVNTGLAQQVIVPIKSSWTGPVATIADYLNAFVLNRTQSLINLLENYSDSSGTYPIDSKINPINTVVRQVNSVTIGWPAPADILGFIPGPLMYQYYPASQSSPNLQNFIALNSNNTAFGNDPNNPMVCDGDLFVAAPVLINNLQLTTNTGCRIYSTNSIFVQAPSNNNPGRDAIVYTNSGTGVINNLQLASSAQIMLGLGQCQDPNNIMNAGLSANYVNDFGQTYASHYGSYGARLKYEDIKFQYQLQTYINDYDAIVDNNNINLLQDAGDCAGRNDPTWAAFRNVNFSHLLLNAPRIDSRYTGNFLGVIIGDEGIWSPGDLDYTYDNIFANGKILPMLAQKKIYDYQDCVDSNGVDHATAKDLNYQVCPSQANKISIVLGPNGAGRRYSDGSFATSCNSYINPSGNYSYSGQTGSGYYTVSVDGVNSFDVYCDMTSFGGGWTKIYRTNRLANFSDDWTTGNTVDSSTKFAYLNIPISASSQIMFVGEYTFDPNTDQIISSSPLTYVFNSCSNLSSPETLAQIMSTNNFLPNTNWSSQCQLDLGKLPLVNPGFNTTGIGGVNPLYGKSLYLNVLDTKPGNCTYGGTKVSIFPRANVAACGGGICGYEISASDYEQESVETCSNPGVPTYHPATNSIDLYVK